MTKLPRHVYVENYMAVLFNDSLEGSPIATFHSVEVLADGRKVC